MAAQDSAVIPDLQLGDIIHSMSPSPTPLQTDHIPRSASPEPLAEAEISRIRQRVAELGALSGESNGLNSREKELLQMLRRLTESPFFDQNQLLYQAEAISGLNNQRDFLMRQVQEERERWASQRDGWERMAEALIAQKNKSAPSESKDDLERSCATYESDNRALKEKLRDTQVRLHCLENEITKLRPLLLMQPVPTANGHNSSLSSLPYPNVQVATEKSKSKKKKKEARVPVYPAAATEEQNASDEQTGSHPMEGVEQPSSSSSFFQFQAQNPPSTSNHRVFTGDHYRKPTATKMGGPLTSPPTTLEFQLNTPATVISHFSHAQTRTTRRPSSPSTPEAPGPSSSSTSNIPSTPRPPSRTNAQQATRSKSKRPQGAPQTPLMSDARAEHLLLAARKVGRVRAGIMASQYRDKQRIQVDEKKQEKEMEKDRGGVRSEKMEKERGTVGSSSYYRQDVGDVKSGTTPKSPQTPKTQSRTTASPRVINSPFVMVGVGSGSNGVGVGHGSKSYGRGGGHRIGDSPTTPRPKQQRGGAAAGAAAGIQQVSSQSNPPTPLSSLLDAARMMDTDSVADGSNGASGSKGRSNGVNGLDEHLVTGRRRIVAAVEEPESPLPKRRRVATMKAVAAKRNNSAGGGGGVEEEREGIRRVRSALDVLADQAAAFSSHDQQRSIKGKGRETHDTDVEDSNYTPTTVPRRTRSSRLKAGVTKEVAEKPKIKSTTTTSRRTRGRPAAAAAATVTEGLNATTSSSSLESSHAPPAVPRMISPPGPRTTIMDSVEPKSRSRSRSGSASLVPPLGVRSSPKASPVGEPIITIDEEEKEPPTIQVERELSVHVTPELDVREEDVSPDLEASSSLVVEPSEALVVEPVDEEVERDRNLEERPTDDVKEEVVMDYGEQLGVGTPVAIPQLAPPVEISDSRSPSVMELATREETAENISSDLVGETIEDLQQGEAEPIPNDIEMPDYVLVEQEVPEKPEQQPVGPLAIEVEEETVIVLSPTHVESQEPDAIPLPNNELQSDSTPLFQSQIVLDPVIVESAPDLSSMQETAIVLGDATDETEHVSEKITVEPVVPPLDHRSPSTPPPPRSPELLAPQPERAEAISPKQTDEGADADPDVDADADLDPDADADGDADADADGDIDAEADIDDGEADAEGEVDAEGDPDLEEMDVLTSVPDPFSEPVHISEVLTTEIVNSTTQ